MGRRMVCSCDHYKSKHVFRRAGYNAYALVCTVPGCQCQRFKEDEAKTAEKKKPASRQAQYTSMTAGLRRLRLFEKYNLDTTKMPIPRE